MNRESFIFRCDYVDKLSQFSNEDIGTIVKSIASYVQNGEIPQLEPMLMVAFNIIRVDIDKDTDKYEKRCVLNKQIAVERWNKEQQNKNNT